MGEKQYRVIEYHSLNKTTIHPEMTEEDARELYKKCLQRSNFADLERIHLHWMCIHRNGTKIDPPKPTSTGEE